LTGNAITGDAMKTFNTKCPCCGSMVEIYPTHPLYEALKAQEVLEKEREAHPEVSEPDSQL